MSGVEDTRTRIQYAIQQSMNRSVMTIARADWEVMINADGLPTKVDSLPHPFSAVMKNAQVVAVAASGYHNPDPGFDIVRLDEKDDPYIYNVDHYTVIQTLGLHQSYRAFVAKAGVEESSALQQCMDEYVFVVKRTPGEVPDHWAEELPQRVRDARTKGL